MMTRVSCNGASGTQYTMIVAPIGASLPKVGGVYLLLSREVSVWRALYVGQSENLDQRVGSNITSRHAWPKFRRFGATHVALVDVSDSNDRLWIERDLIQGLNPPCNDQ